MDALKDHSVKTTTGNLTFSYTHLAAITILIPALRHLYVDYQSFLALGPGGTPKTITGYCKVKALGMFALRDPYAPPKIPWSMTSKAGCISGLSQRRGVRPSTLGIAPHRQINQRPSREMHEKLVDALHDIADANVHLLEGTSCFEKHGTGLFSENPQRRTCGGEICHTHLSDGSMHLTLHPADAKVMLEAGWGERHPLARGGWLERFVPGGFVMIYAPRDDDELDVVLEIVRVAAWYVGGEEIKDGRDKRRDSGQDEQVVAC
ncbi:hypothetical protein AUEXF2481DRAFT_35239 [Aureobasidium subglaciale EXF-2481]|uniref:Luciferase domain-containing protein n=1 Tax=Aureobasidium subglaciale (strain EXF-2481) TaxID=1043005 RepID=A0A074ZLP5_AURSE|nr:uncharacterized protein AUEXF2481DRAFT_35239 [Aureobasidium subglaciale EXF-2481]KEQ99336.1 hypothetical protein AUEXF2481DRAFT_35239 [Aureobasidium subglaciale EXF-2481]